MKGKEIKRSSVRENMERWQRGKNEKFEERGKKKERRRESLRAEEKEGEPSGFSLPVKQIEIQIFPTVISL